MIFLQELQIAGLHITLLEIPRQAYTPWGISRNTGTRVGQTPRGRGLSDNSRMTPSEVVQRNLHHKAHRAGWLRAAVLGANDGLVSISALMVGFAAAEAAGGADGGQSVLLAGLAGLAAGALSMAAGEYVSVSSQTDIETADRQMEIEHLAADPEGELEELAEIYEERGLSPELAKQVAVALTEHDALGAHLREELGHHEISKARPLQAAMASAAAFIAGGIIPFFGLFFDGNLRGPAITAISVVGLCIAGYLSARAAGCGIVRPMMRVVLGGSLAMAVTYVVGTIFGAAV